MIAVSSEPETVSAAELKRCEELPMGRVDEWCRIGTWECPSSVERVRPGLDRKDETQRAGPSAGGVKKDWPCARCVSGGARRDGVGGMDGEREGAGGCARVDGKSSRSGWCPCLCSFRVSRSSAVGGKGMEGDAGVIGASGARSRREMGCAVGNGEGTGVGSWLVLAADSPWSNDAKKLNGS